MKVFLIENVQNVGKAGEVVSVSDGFARNFLLPHKKGIEITAYNEGDFAKRAERMKARESTTLVKKSSLAERIEALQVTIRRKVHDDGKLYGAISTQEISDALAGEGVSVAKNQIIIEKSIKSRGLHSVVIKLSSSLQPRLAVKVVADIEARA